MSIDSVERKRRSLLQEQRWADLIHASLNAGSGSGWKRRQDMRTDAALWELKRTDKASISLKTLDWEQLYRHSLAEGREPRMHLEIGGHETPPLRFVVLSEDDFLGIVDYLGLAP